MPFTSKDYTDIPTAPITVDSIKDGIQSINESIRSRVQAKAQSEIDKVKMMLALYGVFVLNAYGTVYNKVNEVFKKEDVPSVDEGENEVEYKKKKKVNDKQKDDIPDRFKGERPKKGESGKDAAKRVLEERGEYDPDKTGPRTNFNKLKKYFDTHFE